MSLSLNPKYILLRNILSNCLLVYLAPGFFSRSRPNRPVQTDPAQVELAHSTLPLKLNLRFPLSQHTTLPSVSTPCPRSSSSPVLFSSTPLVLWLSTPPVPSILTLPMGLSTRKALVSSFVAPVRNISLLWEEPTIQLRKSQ